LFVLILLCDVNDLTEARVSELDELLAERDAIAAARAFIKADAGDIRRRGCLSLEALARLCKVAPLTLSRWEHGAPPRAGHALKLAALLRRISGSEHSELPTFAPPPPLLMPDGGVGAPLVPLESSGPLGRVQRRPFESSASVSAVSVDDSPFAPSPDSGFMIGGAPLASPPSRMSSGGGDAPLAPTTALGDLCAVGVPEDPDGRAATSTAPAVGILAQERTA